MISSSIVNDMASQCFNHPHDIRCKHIAVLLKKKRPISSYSYNYRVGTGDSVHAEIAALNRIRRRHGKRVL